MLVLWCWSNFHSCLLFFKPCHFLFILLCCLEKSGSLFYTNPVIFSKLHPLDKSPCLQSCSPMCRYHLDAEFDDNGDSGDTEATSTELPWVGSAVSNNPQVESFFQRKSPKHNSLTLMPLCQGLLASCVCACAVISKRKRRRMLLFLYERI